MRHIGVAEAKREFSDLLNRVSYQGERFVVERHGRPMALLVPVGDLSAEGDSQTEARVESALDEKGFLGLVGLFDDGDELADILDEVVASRREQSGRPAPYVGQ
jgi:prevent-host-death family protein